MPYHQKPIQAILPETIFQLLASTKTAKLTSNTNNALQERERVHLLWCCWYAHVPLSYPRVVERAFARGGAVMVSVQCLAERDNLSE